MCACHGKTQTLTEHGADRKARPLATQKRQNFFVAQVSR